MGCGHSKGDDASSRVGSAHNKAEFKKRRNSTKSTTSSSSSSSDDSKHASKKGKKKTGIKENVVSPVIKANEDRIVNNDTPKPLTPRPKSASSRGSITRKSSSSGFAEHDKDALSIISNEVEGKADEIDGERKSPIFTIGQNEEEGSQKDMGPKLENLTYINENGGEENQNAKDIDDEQNENDDEDNISVKSGNNENDNDTLQTNVKNVDDEDLGIYEDNGNNNDIDDENDKDSDVDDAEQQTNDDGEDIPDTFREYNDDAVNHETNERSDILESEEEGDNNITPTPRSEAVEEGLDVPDTFVMGLTVGPLEMEINLS